MLFTYTVMVTCYYCINSCIAEHSPYLPSRNNIHDYERQEFAILATVSFPYFIRDYYGS